MSTYNTIRIDDVTISQAVDEDGRYAIVLQKGNRVETRSFNSEGEQCDCFERNVKWYRGY